MKWQNPKNKSETMHIPNFYFSFRVSDDAWCVCQGKRKSSSSIPWVLCLLVHDLRCWSTCLETMATSMQMVDIVSLFICYWCGQSVGRAAECLWSYCWKDVPHQGKGNSRPTSSCLGYENWHSLHYNQPGLWACSQSWLDWGKLYLCCSLEVLVCLSTVVFFAQRLITPEQAVCYNLPWRISLDLRGVLQGVMALERMWLQDRIESQLVWSMSFLW